MGFLAAAGGLLCCGAGASYCGASLLEHRLWSTGPGAQAQKLRVHRAELLQGIRDLSWTRDRTCVLCLAGGFLSTRPPGKSLNFEKFQTLQRLQEFTQIFQLQQLFLTLHIYIFLLLNHLRNSYRHDAISPSKYYNMHD